MMMVYFQPAHDHHADPILVNERRRVAHLICLSDIGCDIRAKRPALEQDAL